MLARIHLRITLTSGRNWAAYHLFGHVLVTEVESVGDHFGNCGSLTSICKSAMANLLQFMDPASGYREGCVLGLREGARKRRRGQEHGFCGSLVHAPRISPRQAKEIVRVGWNDRSLAYRPPHSSHDGTGHWDREYRSWLRPILRETPRGGDVLDLGCGCGVPASRLLANRFRVIGVDISDVQIARARQLVPKATFRRADMTTVRFPPRSFHAVVSLYAIIHVPLREQRPLFLRVFRWLRPGGLFIAVLGSGWWKGIERGWLGSESPMFWDHASADTYQRWLKDCGFLMEERKHVPEMGSGGHELFWVLRPE